MPKKKKWVGIDIGKEELVIAVYPLKETWSVAYKPKVLKQLVKQLLILAPEKIIVEATGGYEKLLIEQLLKANLPVSMVNPRQIRDYAKSQGLLAKTDQLDAGVIAEFGAKCDNLRLTVLPSISEQELKDLVTRRQQLIEMLSMENNRFQQAPRKLQPKIREHMDWLEEQLKQLDEEMKEVTQGSSKLQAKENLLRSAPGVGPVLARTMMALVPELGRIGRKEIAALIGVAPLNCDSGKFKGQRKIWGGRASVRTVLYMGTVAAIRRKNNPFGKMYDRLRSAGKLAKVAIVAVMRKLLTVLNAMLRDQLSWQEMKISSCPS